MQNIEVQNIEALHLMMVSTLNKNKTNLFSTSHIDYHYNPQIWSFPSLYHQGVTKGGGYISLQGQLKW